MHAAFTTPPTTGLRDLFAEAAERRRKGAAAHVVGLAALVAVSAIVAEARREVQHG